MLTPEERTRAIDEMLSDPTEIPVILYDITLWESEVLRYLTPAIEAWPMVEIRRLRRDFLEDVDA